VGTSSRANDGERDEAIEDQAGGGLHATSDSGQPNEGSAPRRGVLRGRGTHPEADDGAVPGGLGEVTDWAVKPAIEGARHSAVHLEMRDAYTVDTEHLKTWRDGVPYDPERGAWWHDMRGPVRRRLRCSLGAGDATCGLPSMTYASSNVQTLRVELGQRLRDVRTEAGLSARALAALMGRHPSKVSRIENGAVTPGVAPDPCPQAAVPNPPSGFPATGSPRVVGDDPSM
jgi:hypothetical protein